MYKIKTFLLFTYIFSQGVLSQSLNDIQKMKSEYEKMKNQSSTLIENQQGEFGQNEDIVNPNQINLVPYRDFLIKDTLEVSSKYFGYDFFTKRDSVSFWENFNF